MWDRFQWHKLSWYVANHWGELSLAILRGVAVSTGKSWAVNGHATRWTCLLCMAMKSGVWLSKGCRSRDQHRHVSRCGLGMTLFLTLVVVLFFLLLFLSDAENIKRRIILIGEVRSQIRSHVAVFTASRDHWCSTQVCPRLRHWFHSWCEVRFADGLVNGFLWHCHCS